MKEHFLLDPNITFLNFGSFGACPKPVFNNLLTWQRLLEHNPVQYIAVNSAHNHAIARKALAEYVNCDADDLVFVLNPSYAMNVVARNLPLTAGDEILSTNMEYGACDRIFQYYTKQKGAIYRQQPISLPIISKQTFIDEFFAGWNERTKIVFIGQITSSTALILPVKEIIDEAKRRGAITIVDGAHVPGHIDLDLTVLDADVYTGACHKWMLTPKGVSFLYVRNALQKLMDPLVVSWGYDSDRPSHSQFLDYHQMIGTRDFSASLTLPAAIEFMKQHNWKEVSAQCKILVREWAPKFCDLMNTSALCPITEEFVPQMFSIPIRSENPDALQRLLFQEYHIEIPVTRLHQKLFIRYSINAFNEAADLEKLYKAMQTIMKTQPSLLQKF